MGIHRLSTAFANYLAGKLNYDQDQEDVLRYGFEVLIGEFIKITVLLLLSFVLGIFPYALLITFTTITYRFLAGGVHFNSYGRCFIFSLILILSLGKICQSFVGWELSLFSILLPAGGIFFAVFSLTFKYAPLEAANKPITITKKRKMKKLSLIWLGVCFTAVALSLIIAPMEKIQAYIIAVLFSILVQAFSLLPIVFKTVTIIECHLDKLLPKGGEKYVQDQA